MRLADGRTQTFALAGDEIYIDAHILKWQPIANMVGLHTAYELDRIAGRYHALKDEQALPRTVHALGAPKPIDLFSLRRRYVMLAPARRRRIRLSVVRAGHAAGRARGASLDDRATDPRESELARRNAARDSGAARRRP